MAAFRVGDLVWAKMRHFPSWPAKIIEPKPEIKKPRMKKNMEFYFVFFFGAENVAWLQEDCLFPYVDYKERFSLTSRVPGGFKEAIVAIEEVYKTMPEPLPPTELPTIDDELKQIFSDEGEPQENSTLSQVPNSATKSIKKMPRPKPETDLSAVKDKTTRQRKPTEKVLSARKRPLLGRKEPLSKKKARLSPGQQDIAKRRRSEPPRKKLNVRIMPRPSLPNDKPKYMPQSPESNRHSLSAATQMDDYIAAPRPQKAIIPTPMRIGYLGLGIMGQGMVMNLMRSGHEVMVWNRTASKCRDFVYDGALKGNTPSDVVAACDITFACVADPNASRDLVFGNSGVLQEMKHGKSYVDMSTVDVDTAEEISEAITQRGGRFLEAPVVGSRVPAVEGELIILASGSKDLCDDCYSCFEAMGKKSLFLGEVGAATRMKLVINMIIGTMMASIAEGMALAEKTGLDQEDVSAILGLSSVSSEFVKHKAAAIINSKYEAHFPLQHQQKDLRLACLLGDIVEQPLYLAAVANELYKKARRFGYGESDISAVYRAANA